MGLAWLYGGFLKKVSIANAILLACLRILTAVAEAGGYYGLEHPKDPATEPFPSIWILAQVALLEETGSGSRADFEQRYFKAPSVKPTTISSNCRELERRFAGKKGPPGGLILEGKEADGTFATSRGQTYTSEMNLELAEMFLESMMSGAGVPPALERISPEKEVELRAAMFRTQREEKAQRIPVPAVGENWDPVRRWSLALQARWTKVEHQNVLELRTVMLAGRVSMRQASSWNKRILIMTDSLVSIGAAMKGRSSSKPLLRILRMMAADQLMAGCLYYVRWIPGFRNHADGPSRLQAIGQASKALTKRYRFDPTLAAEKGVVIDGMRQ